MEISPWVTVTVQNVSAEELPALRGFASASGYELALTQPSADLMTVTLSQPSDPKVKTRHDLRAAVGTLLALYAFQEQSTLDEAASEAKTYAETIGTPETSGP